MAAVSVAATKQVRVAATVWFLARSLHAFSAGSGAEEDPGPVDPSRFNLNKRVYTPDELYRLRTEPANPNPTILRDLYASPSPPHEHEDRNAKPGRVNRDREDSAGSDDRPLAPMGPGGRFDNVRAAGAGRGFGRGTATGPQGPDARPGFGRGMPSSGPLGGRDRDERAFEGHREARAEWASERSDKARDKRSDERFERMRENFEAERAKHLEEMRRQAGRGDSGAPGRASPEPAVASSGSLSLRLGGESERAALPRARSKDLSIEAEFDEKGDILLSPQTRAFPSSQLKSELQKPRSFAERREERPPERTTSFDARRPGGPAVPPSESFGRDRERRGPESSPRGTGPMSPTAPRAPMGSPTGRSMQRKLEQRTAEEKVPPPAAPRLARRPPSSPRPSGPLQVPELPGTGAAELEREQRAASARPLPSGSGPRSEQPAAEGAGAASPAKEKRDEPVRPARRPRPAPALTSPQPARGGRPRRLPTGADKPLGPPPGLGERPAAARTRRSLRRGGQAGAAAGAEGAGERKGGEDGEGEEGPDFINSLFSSSAALGSSTPRTTGPKRASPTNAPSAASRFSRFFAADEHGIFGATRPQGQPQGQPQQAGPGQPSGPSMLEALFKADFGQGPVPPMPGSPAGPLRPPPPPGPRRRAPRGLPAARRPRCAAGGRVGGLLLSLMFASAGEAMQRGRRRRRRRRRRERRRGSTALPALVGRHRRAPAEAHPGGPRAAPPRPARAAGPRHPLPRHPPGPNEGAAFQFDGAPKDGANPTAAQQARHAALLRATGGGGPGPAPGARRRLASPRRPYGVPDLMAILAASGASPAPAPGHAPPRQPQWPSAPLPAAPTPPPPPPPLRRRCRRRLKLPPARRPPSSTRPQPKMFLPKKKKPLFDFDEVSPINKVLFPAPSPFYEENSFPGELCWIGDPPSPCLVLPVPGGARYLLIYMHGNAEDIGCSRPLMMALRFSLQCHIIAVEYPGYGCFPGRPNEANVNDALNRVVTYCVNVLKFDQKNIILFGRSIGRARARRSRHLMGAAAQYLISDRFKSDEEIQNAETLYNLCPSIMKRLAVSETMDHNNFDLEDDVVQPVQMFLCSMDERGAGPPRDLAIEKARFTCPPEMRSQRSQSATPGASGSAGGSGRRGAAERPSFLRNPPPCSPARRARPAPPRTRPARPPPPRLTAGRADDPAESLAGGGAACAPAPPAGGPGSTAPLPTVDPGPTPSRCPAPPRHRRGGAEGRRVQLAMLREMGFVDERAALRVRAAAAPRGAGRLERGAGGAPGGGDLETAVELLSASFLDAVQAARPPPPAPPPPHPPPPPRPDRGGRAPLVGRRRAGGPAAARARGRTRAAAAAARGAGRGAGRGGLGAGRRAADVRGGGGKYNAAVSTMREMGFQEAEEVLVQALKSARAPSSAPSPSSSAAAGPPAAPPRPGPLSPLTAGSPTHAPPVENARGLPARGRPGGPRGGGGAGGALLGARRGAGGAGAPWVDAAESPTPRAPRLPLPPDSAGARRGGLAPAAEGRGGGCGGERPEAAGAPEEADYGAQLAAMAEMGFGDAPAPRRPPRRRRRRRPRRQRPPRLPE
eukprot:tig00001302_g8086.t1